MAGMSLWHILFYHQDDDISPLEEALTTQVVHQLRDKGQSFSTSWGKDGSGLIHKVHYSVRVSALPAVCSHCSVQIRMVFT